ncbi:hypothetical protein [Gemmatimonas sp.]|uniref:hypothetical protein n=1 Tax=Gemmatimonas sp. TaxID=1962908 RepID=UPI003983181A
MTRRWRFVCAVGLALPPVTAMAQDHKTGGNEGKRPIGWQLQTDAGGHKMAGDVETVAFAQMTPGFHVTTGPAAILWHPDSAASGAYTVESTIFLFPTNGRDQEGYGVFVGGTALTDASPSYTYFLLRNDGKFLVKQRQGEKTVTLATWTPLPAIVKQAGADAAKNVLRVEVASIDVAFTVNGVEAVRLPRATVRPDGVFGVRINHAVNAHVSSVGRAK